MANGSFFVAIAMITAITAPGYAAVEVERPDVSKMKMSQIRAHNAAVDKTHRFFIVCRTDTITGSLSRRAKVCRTREDWDKMARLTQQFLNEAIEKNSAMPVPPPQ